MRFEFSAGGIVYKKTNNSLLILVAQHSQHHGWVFPKGLIGDKIQGENKEDTALREVKEETGIEGKILQHLDPIQFWYVFNGEKIKKTVYYYLMGYVSGDTSDHDFEMENVEWISIGEVENRLTYKSDKKVFEQAKPIINNLVNKE